MGLGGAGKIRWDGCVVYLLTELSKGSCAAELVEGFCRNFSRAHQSRDMPVRREMVGCVRALAKARWAGRSFDGRAELGVVRFVDRYRGWTVRWGDTDDDGRFAGWTTISGRALRSIPGLDCSRLDRWKVRWTLVYGASTGGRLVWTFGWVSNAGGLRRCGYCSSAVGSFAVGDYRWTGGFCGSGPRGCGRDHFHFAYLARRRYGDTEAHFIGTRLREGRCYRAKTGGMVRIIFGREIGGRDALGRTRMDRLG
ncbi:hypothetical protein KCP77_12755 [Salmonella enterica subsp. enterica]|nr:hypothetical protein KCP77_12755 [Salmonella enterica subsp. enterica]